jgi:endonuclease/exonuclease/phosphatase family metal-dependent hydrolase
MIRSAFRAFSARSILLVIALFALAAVFAPVAGAHGSKGHHGSHHGSHWPSHPNLPEVKVMTRNMYFGADLTRAIAAPTVPDFLAANAQIFANVQHSDLPARAKSIAREIAFRHPDLVGLQEVSQWLSGPFNDPADATTVEYDQLASLLSALAFYGSPYKVVKAQQEISIEAPAGAPYFKDFRLVDRDVILAPLWGSQGVSLSNPAGANFANNLTVTSGIGQSIAVKRGWASVDVNAKGHKFRFVNTHLESFHPGFRAIQAGELVAPTGPVGSAAGKAVLVGDMNSDPNQASPDNLAYNTLVGAGLVDTWTVANPADPGLTCCFDELLDNPSPAGVFDQRIDHVFTKGAIGVSRARIVGLNPFNKTQSGLWPSDHAGVVTKLTP